MRPTLDGLMPTALAIDVRLQWVAFAGVSFAVFVRTASLFLFGNGAIRDGRVLSRRSPSTPASMKRSCQRQTHGFDLPVRRMISLVPWPSVVARTISARHTAFLELLRSAMIASSALRFAGET